MVLDIADFTKQHSLSFDKALSKNLSPPGSGHNFCKQRLKYSYHKFFSTLKTEMKIKYKYIDHFPKIVCGCFLWLQDFPL